MAKRSNIEYTFSTWNPITGCTPVSAGCQHCYAERMANRLHAMGVPKYQNGFQVTTHENVLETPLKWRKPRVVFVNSMSDMFHEDVPFDYVRRIFDVMQRADQHIFQILTKRSRALKRLSARLPWPDNVWMGVTVENSNYKSRIDDLRAVPAKTRWLSMEPLLGPVEGMDLSGIHWVVVGGESGPGARPIEKQWVLDILRQCREQDTAFFFKQWGGVNKRKAGRRLNGRHYNEMPDLPSEASRTLQASLF
jgi:protein gp37